MRRAQGSFTVVLAVVTGIFLIGPVLIVVIMSFTSGDSLSFPPPGFSTRWYQEALTDPKWTSRLAVSFNVAMATMITATVAGTMLAIGLERYQFRGKSLVWAMILGPMVMPLVVLATGEFFVMAEGWGFGSMRLGSGLVGTMWALILAHTVLALPYPTILVSSALRAVDPNLEWAAGSLGAGPWRRFRSITLPLIAPGVVAGAVFAFLISWDEVVVATFFTNGRMSTVPVQILADLSQNLSPAAAAISTLLLAISLVGLLLLGIVRRRARQSPPFQLGEP